VIRDIGRTIEGNSGLEAAFAKLLPLARRVREQQQRQRGPKVYSLHAPEVECIGKGKAQRPYEFGVKVSVTTTISPAKAGQFVTHVKTMPGNPYDGHTLATLIRTWRRWSATSSHASSPTRDTAATTRRPITSSGSSSPARSEG
jgi:IS5 family transposase